MEKVNNKNTWTRRDYLDVVTASAITVLFAIRGGEWPQGLFITIRYILAYFFYGAVMVLMFIGLTKKMFKYEPNRKRMIKWAFYLAAFFSVSQMFHEGFLMLTGQPRP